VFCLGRPVCIASSYPARDTQRVTNYRRYLNSIDLTGIKFPTPINQVGRFEKNNPTVSINVYVLGKNEKEIIPKYVTKCGKRQKHIDLLALNIRRQVALCLDQEHECSDMSQIKAYRQYCMPALSFIHLL
jgi:hypothetical protein